MKNFWNLSLCFILLAACNSNTLVKKPKNLLTKELMIEIITDTYIAKAASTERNIMGDKHVNYHPLVYKKYQIDSVRFNSSLKYYISRINDSEKIFKAVEQKLEKQVTLLNKELKTEEKNTNSK